MKTHLTVAISIAAMFAPTSLAGAGQSSQKYDPVTVTLWDDNDYQGVEFLFTYGNACVNLPVGFKAHSMTRSHHYYNIRLWEGRDCTGDNRSYPDEESWYFPDLGRMDGEVVSVSTCDPSLWDKCLGGWLAKRAGATFAGYAVPVAGAVSGPLAEVSTKFAVGAVESALVGRHFLDECRFCQGNVGQVLDHYTTEFQRGLDPRQDQKADERREKKIQKAVAAENFRMEQEQKEKWAAEEKERNEKLAAEEKERKEKLAAEEKERKEKLAAEEKEIKKSVAAADKIYKEIWAAWDNKQKELADKEKEQEEKLADEEKKRRLAAEEQERRLAAADQERQRDVFKLRQRLAALQQERTGHKDLRLLRPRLPAADQERNGRELRERLAAMGKVQDQTKSQ